ncbi:MAG: hypothetical protein V1926_02320 [Candidatus Peregrinibacteria bacterium]
MTPEALNDGQRRGNERPKAVPVEGKQKITTKAEFYNAMTRKLNERYAKLQDMYMETLTAMEKRERVLRERSDTEAADKISVIRKWLETGWKEINQQIDVSEAAWESRMKEGKGEPTLLQISEILCSRKQAFDRLEDIIKKYTFQLVDPARVAQPARKIPTTASQTPESGGAPYSSEIDVPSEQEKQMGYRLLKKCDYDVIAQLPVDLLSNFGEAWDIPIVVEVDSQCQGMDVDITGMARNVTRLEALRFVKREVEKRPVRMQYKVDGNRIIATVVPDRKKMEQLDQIDRKVSAAIGPVALRVYRDQKDIEDTIKQLTVQHIPDYEGLLSDAKIRERTAERVLRYVRNFFVDAEGHMFRPFYSVPAQGLFGDVRLIPDTPETRRQQAVWAAALLERALKGADSYDEVCVRVERAMRSSPFLLLDIPQRFAFATRAMQKFHAENPTIFPAGHKPWVWVGKRGTTGHMFYSQSMYGAKMPDSYESEIEPDMSIFGDATDGAASPGPAATPASPGPAPAEKPAKVPAELKETKKEEIPPFIREIQEKIPQLTVAHPISTIKSWRVNRKMENQKLVWITPKDNGTFELKETTGDSIPQPTSQPKTCADLSAVIADIGKWAKGEAVFEAPVPAPAEAAAAKEGNVFDTFYSTLKRSEEAYKQGDAAEGHRFLTVARALLGKLPPSESSGERSISVADYYLRISEHAGTERATLQRDALQLLQEAANEKNGLAGMSAARYLAALYVHAKYRSFRGIPRDVQKSLEWQKKAIDIVESLKSRPANNTRTFQDYASGWIDTLRKDVADVIDVIAQKADAPSTETDAVELLQRMEWLQARGCRPNNESRRLWGELIEKLGKTPGGETVRNIRTVFGVMNGE